jgi:O-antigen/teichoic acid export membrane protein
MPVGENRKLKSNIIANYLGSGWSALMSFAFIPLYVRYLGMESYGLIGIFSVMQAWFMLVEVGLAPTLGREMARFQAGAHTAKGIRDLLWSIELICFGIAAVILTAALASADWLATDWLTFSSLPPATVSSALAVMGGVVSVRFLVTVYRSALAGLEHQVWLGCIGAVFATGRGVGVVAVIVWVSPSVVAFFLFQAVISVIEAMVVAFKVKQSLPRSPQRVNFDIRALSEVKQFAGGISTITLLKLVLTQLDKVLLSTLLPLVQFGHYMLAAAVANVFAAMTAPLTSAIYPRLIRFVTSENGPSLKKTYHDFTQLLVIVITPAAMILILFCDHVLLLWTRDAAVTQAAAPILVLLIVGAFFNALIQPAYFLQLAHGATKFAVLVNAVSAVIVVPATFLAIRHFGSIGAPTVWVLLNVGYMIVVPSLTHRHMLIGEGRRWYIIDVLFPVGSAVSAVALLYFLVPDPSIDQPLDSVLVLLGAAVVSFGIAVIATPLGRLHAGRVLGLPRNRIGR